MYVWTDCSCVPLPHAVAVVGLEKTVYVVSETVGMVEVCVVVHQPNTEPCPISFPFEVVLSTINGTAS